MRRRTKMHGGDDNYSDVVDYHLFLITFEQSLILRENFKEKMRIEEGLRKGCAMHDSRLQFAEWT